MILIDVNVLVYAHRKDAQDHSAYRNWLEGVLSSDPVYGMSDHVLSGVIRQLTHPKIFLKPSSLDEAFGFARYVRFRPNCALISPGPRHWEIFERLSRAVNARGNLVPDAYFAALAVEHDCEWISADRDFARFPNLRWRHPLGRP